MHLITCVCFFVSLLEWCVQKTIDIPTKEGTLYLGVNIDVFPRNIVGWSMSSRMQDKLVIDCFLQACGKEQPQPALKEDTEKNRTLKVIKMLK